MNLRGLSLFHIRLRHAACQIAIRRAAFCFWPMLNTVNRDMGCMFLEYLPQSTSHGGNIDQNT